jgi:hypothetical protein
MKLIVLSGLFLYAYMASSADIVGPMVVACGAVLPMFENRPFGEDMLVTAPMLIPMVAGILIGLRVLAIALEMNIPLASVCSGPCQSTA